MPSLQFTIRTSLVLLHVIAMSIAATGAFLLIQENRMLGVASNQRECTETWFERWMGCECGDGRGGVGRFGFLCPKAARVGVDGDGGKGKWKRGVEDGVVVQGGEGNGLDVDKVEEEGSGRRTWVSQGSGWKMRVDLTTWPHAPSVSPLDWSVRWNSAKHCLSTPEWDNADNFEIDEVALKAFWDRAWICFLPYAMGEVDGEMNEMAEKSNHLCTRQTTEVHEVPGVTPRQSNQGLAVIMTPIHVIKVVFLFILGVLAAISVNAGALVVDVVVWWIMLVLDLVEGMIGLFYRFYPGR